MSFFSGTGLIREFVESGQARSHRKFPNKLFYLFLDYRYEPGDKINCPGAMGTNVTYKRGLFFHPQSKYGIEK